MSDDPNHAQNNHNTVAPSIDDYTPPEEVTPTMSTTPTPTPTPTTDPMMPSASSADSDSTEALEDQNIFELLGVQDGSDEEREQFLDELQQVIWDDFIENDVKLLVTDQEMEGLTAILNKEGMEEEQKQEEIVVYLEKLIPDLEDVMLEKALELKEDMARERIAGMRDYFENNQPMLDKIAAAEQQFNRDQWRSGAVTLNQMVEEFEKNKPQSE